MNVLSVNISEQRTRTMKGLLAVVLLFALAVLHQVPAEHLPFAACAFHSLTGYSCLTCGLTRSLQAILHGDVIASFKFHVMGPVISLLAMFSIFTFSVETLTGKDIALMWRLPGWKKIFSWIALVWLFYWGVRLISEMVA